ncbi:MAG TPA: hypothetical protein VF278_15845 [Pirellulales bacterium]
MAIRPKRFAVFCLAEAAWALWGNSSRGRLIGVTDEIIAVTKGASKKESARRLDARCRHRERADV